ncbi:MAG TPA: ACT domain-containing protein [Acidimicrobiales bacterium]|jgi:hypothetical protein|nr:ACT domain-containing protein [Acidimicrobiales bacterium]
MSSVVRIRVSLADRAGALGQAATVIGLHGGNILSIDVHGTDGSLAIDDLVVDFALEPAMEDLVADLAMAAATIVLHSEPSAPVDPLTAVLTALRFVPGHRPHLTEVLDVICPFTEWSTATGAPGPAPDGTVQIVVPMPGSDESLVGRRPAGMAFTATEWARVDAAAHLGASVGLTV